MCFSCNDRYREVVGVFIHMSLNKFQKSFLAPRFALFHFL